MIEEKRISILGRITYKDYIKDARLPVELPGLGR